MNLIGGGQHWHNAATVLLEMDVIKNLSAETVHDDQTVETYPMSSLEKVYCVPLEVEANCCWEIVEVGTKTVSQSMRVKYLEVPDWIGWAIWTILGTGQRDLDGWDYNIKVVVIHHYYIGFKDNNHVILSCILLIFFSLETFTVFFLSLAV